MAKLHKEAAMVNNNARIIAESMGSSDEDDVIMSRIDYLIENFDYRHPRSLDQLGVILEAIQIEPSVLMGWLASLGVSKPYMTQVQRLVKGGGRLDNKKTQAIGAALKSAGGASRDTQAQKAQQEGDPDKALNSKLDSYKLGPGEGVESDSFRQGGHAEPAEAEEELDLMPAEEEKESNRASYGDPQQQAPQGQTARQAKMDPLNIQQRNAALAQQAGSEEGEGAKQPPNVTPVQSREERQAALRAKAPKKRRMGGPRSAGVDDGRLGIAGRTRKKGQSQYAQERDNVKQSKIKSKQDKIRKAAKPVDPGDPNLTVRQREAAKDAAKKPKEMRNSPKNLKKRWGKNKG